MHRSRLSLFIAVLLLSVEAMSGALQLPPQQAEEIGRRIWKNECAGTVDGLTSWNSGEDFASLGIGHFIWYPEGKRGPFHESFPELVRYLGANGIKVDAWMLGPCPWKTKAEFTRDFRSQRMNRLRTLLAETVALQAQFALLRLEKALPTMLKAAAPNARERVRENFERVAKEPLGPYALIDYVNFKGEGISPTERYKGEGWGLLQVLETMGSGPALPAFAKAADAVLTQRVRSSPPARNEAKWLPGWRNRIATYTR